MNPWMTNQQAVWKHGWTHTSRFQSALFPTTLPVWPSGLSVLVLAPQTIDCIDFFPSTYLLSWRFPSLVRRNCGLMTMLRPHWQTNTTGTSSCGQYYELMQYAWYVSWTKQAQLKSLMIFGLHLSLHSKFLELYVSGFVLWPLTCTVYLNEEQYLFKQSVWKGRKI